MSLISQVCSIPGVIDVSPAERFGEQVVVVTIPTSAEHDGVRSLLPVDGHNHSFHVMPLFGLGSFTGNSPVTKAALSLMYVEPYNVYGTPENEKLEVLLDDIWAQEAEVWASMSADERRKAIAKEVDRTRASGRTEFGNCWAD